MALRLMCITAHPDDESGAFGGALMRAHARGAQTIVLCLTDGGAASHRGNAKDSAELGRLRREEFKEALHALDVDAGEILGYADGGLARESFRDVVAALVDRMRRFRPQVVLTFGGDGGVNRHPDHTMASLFATAAFHWSGRKTLPGAQPGAASEAGSALAPYSPQKLYYSRAPFLLGAPEEIRCLARVPFSLRLDVEDLKVRKYEAFRRHTTQAPILDRAGELFNKSAGEEHYLLAAARGRGEQRPERGIFDGVVED